MPHRGQERLGLFPQLPVDVKRAAACGQEWKTDRARPCRPSHLGLRSGGCGEASPSEFLLTGTQARHPLPQVPGGLPAPGQDRVDSRDTIRGGLDLDEVVGLHQTRGGLQQSGKTGLLSLGRAGGQQSRGPPSEQPRALTMRKAE